MGRRTSMQTASGVIFHTLGDGPEAILCHSSLGLGRFLFHRVAPGWARRYTVVTWDQRGVGDNRHLPVAMEDWTGDAAEIIEAVGRPCHLLGVSLGSFVMARLAAKGDDRIRTVALVSTSLGFTNGDQLVAARSEAIQRDGMQAYAQKYADMTLTEYAGPEVHGNLVQELGEMDPNVYLESLRITYQQDNGSVFAAVRQPTLVVVGTLDHTTPPADAELAARVLPNSWLAVIVRAGHLVPLDQSGRLNEVLEEFWEA